MPGPSINLSLAAETMMMIRELDAVEEEEEDRANTRIPTELAASGLQHRLNNLSD